MQIGEFLKCLEKKQSKKLIPILEEALKQLKRQVYEDQAESQTVPPPDPPDPPEN